MGALSKIVRAIFVLIVFFGWGAAPVLADSIPMSPAASPDEIPAVVRPLSNGSNYSRAPDGFDISTASSAIADAIAEGGRSYYIGNHGGLDGWLLVKGNEIQVVYVSADRKTLLVGLLFGPEGYNITSDQVRELLRSNKQASAEISVMMRQQLGINDDNNPMIAGAPPVPKLGLQSSQQTAASKSPPNPAEKQIVSSMPPGERLLLDLQDASGVDVGDSQAPLLYMVIDPENSHSQATWRALRDAVFKKTLRIHLVPMGKNDSAERAAARLLSASNPLDAWDKYVAGDKSQLSGQASEVKFLEGVKANHVLVDNWSISETPYMAYRSKTGDVKILAGEPEHVATLLGDIGP